MIVLDSYAVLAYLQGEPSAQDVRQAFRRAQKGTLEIFLSLINLGECIYVIERKQNFNEAQNAIVNIEALPLSVVPADRKLVFEAAHLKANYPVSYADAFAAALAMRHRARLMTGDLEFKALEKEVAIHWLR